LKRILSIICVLAILLGGGIFFKEAHSERASELSYGIEVLQAAKAQKKGSLCGSAISFTKEDFKESIGEEVKQIRILKTPNPNIGILYFNGTPVKEECSFSIEEVQQLMVIPVDACAGESYFTFSAEPYHGIYRFELLFSDRERGIPIAENKQVSTYRNVAVSDRLEGKTNSDLPHFEIISPCKNGILQCNPNSGEFTYYPETNHTGTDRFQYRVIDDYGVKSEAKTVEITVKKADQNLYFYDLAENKNHRFAIFVCEKNLMSYSLNSDGLPCFHPTEPVKYEEFISAVATVSGQRKETLQPVFAEHFQEKKPSLTDDFALKCLKTLSEGIEKTEAADAFEKVLCASTSETSGNFSSPDTLTREKFSVLLCAFLSDARL